MEKIDEATMELPGGGAGNVRQVFRYGENPHQKYCALVEPDGTEIGPFAIQNFTLIEGGTPSGTNITDLDRVRITASAIGAAFETNFGFVPLMSIGVKHGNACGATVARTPIEALKNMVTGDEQAISGGTVLVNFPFTEAHADILNWYRVTSGQRRLYDVIIAPSFSDAAIEKLARVKTGKCRLLVNPALASKGLGISSISAGRQYRDVTGGFIVQDRSTFVPKVPDDWRTHSLTQQRAEDLILGWAICSTSNSNTIVLVKNGMLIGRGVAQASRVFACKVAVLHARESGHDTAGALACSDSFFSFDDGPRVLAEAGVSVIFATSGSTRDEEVRAFCAQAGITLLQLPDSEARGFYGH